MNTEAIWARPSSTLVRTLHFRRLSIPEAFRMGFEVMWLAESGLADAASIPEIHKPPQVGLAERHLGTQSEAVSAACLWRGYCVR